MTRLAVDFAWRELGDLELDAAGRLRFPGVAREPGLYEFWVAREDERPGVYIGEADDLRARFQGYRTPGPGQATNRRLNASLRQDIGRDATVTIFVVTAARVQLDAVEWRDLDLSRKNQRLVVEQAAIAAILLAEHPSGDVTVARPRLLNLPGVGEEAYG